jgi:rubrerythrin
MAQQDGLQQLDELINRLIETDQTGGEIDPIDVAHELGQIRSLLMAAPTVHRGDEDLRHFRCESCGTITHGEAAPSRCARCGKSRLINVDIDVPAAASAGNRR